jgi:hypothetical protein
VALLPLRGFNMNRAKREAAKKSLEALKAIRINQKQRSIKEEKLITIEVRNSARKIVQARGKYNRQTTSEEFKYITKWANENGLQIQLGFW